MLEEVCLDVDAFSAWDGFFDEPEKSSFKNERNWTIEFPIQTQSQTSLSKTDTLAQHYIQRLLLQQAGQNEKLINRANISSNYNRFPTNFGFINFGNSQLTGACSKAGSGINANGEFRVDITFGGGREEPEINFGASAGVSDNEGNKASISVDHNSNKNETNIGVSAETSHQSDKAKK